MHLDDALLGLINISLERLSLVSFRAWRVNAMIMLRVQVVGTVRQQNGGYSCGSAQLLNLLLAPRLQIKDMLALLVIWQSECEGSRRRIIMLLVVHARCNGHKGT